MIDWGAAARAIRSAYNTDPAKLTITQFNDLFRSLLKQDAPERMRVMPPARTREQLHRQLDQVVPWQEQLIQRHVASKSK